MSSSRSKGIDEGFKKITWVPWLTWWIAKRVADLDCLGMRLDCQVCSTFGLPSMP
jgi:hypothetical protein